MKIKLSICFLCTLILGIVGCNLFNPTGSANIDSSDANALTYEGYQKFRANDYSEAAYYFSKAIEADSSHSEAWYGLAKAKTNILEVNTFELLKYVNTDSKSELPIAGMDDITANRYQEATNIIISFLAEFISRDTTGRLDNVITYNNVYKDVMVLDIFQFMLNLRKEMPFITKCQNRDPNTGLPTCSMGDIINGISPERASDILEAANGFAQTCANKPEVGETVLGSMIPGFASMLSKEGKNTVTATTCQVIANKTKPSEDPSENEKGLTLLSSLANTSPTVDEDGDGCIDEEVLDDRDNDGDGEIDEDSRDLTSEISLDQIAMTKRAILHGDGSIIIHSVGPNEKYDGIDIDMDKEKAEDDEWSFIYADYNQREEYGDHRFKFASDLVFNPKGLPPDEFTLLKHKVAKDIQGNEYNLEFRRENIGGCWPRYSESDFQKALEVQRARYQ